MAKADAEAVVEIYIKMLLEINYSYLPRRSDGS